MNETSIALPQDTLDQYDSEECDSDYQVDTISTASCQDEENQHSYETKDVLAVSNQPKPPCFKSVSVVNSNDVHFGNKTVYKGPVTIKQFVYPNGEIIKTESGGGFETSEDIVDVKKGQNGIYNPTFIKDDGKLSDETNIAPDIGNGSNSTTFLERITKGNLFYI